MDESASGVATFEHAQERRHNHRGWELRLCHIPIAHPMASCRKRYGLRRCGRVIRPGTAMPRISRNSISIASRSECAAKRHPLFVLQGAGAKFAPGIDVDRVGSTAAPIEAICSRSKQVGGYAAAPVVHIGCRLISVQRDHIVRSHSIGE